MTNQNLSKSFDTGKVNQSIFSSTSDEFKMTIDPNSMQHIISRLTDLYEDPIKATVREIISNAIDATQHVDLKNRKPIDITVPGTFQHEFIVTDHALGLTLDEVKNIYTRYGASTKRTDFTQIGAYGLGSKSPLSYTSSFNVRTAKDGYETELLISIEDGKNNVKVVSHEPTDKDNYMTVAIPVREDDTNKFEEALQTYVINPVKDIEFTGLDVIAENVQDKIATVHLGELDYEGIPLTLSYRYQKHSYNSKTEGEAICRALFSLRDAQDDSNYRNLHATLLGYEYELNNEYTYSTSGQFVVELVPGLVDFSSSRDNITNTPRKEKLVKFIEDYIHDHNDVLIDSFISEINKFSNSDVIKYDIFDTHYYLGNLNDKLNESQLNELGKLSNGKSLYEDRDKFDVIVSFNKEAFAGYSGLEGLRYNASVFNIKQTLKAYFNPSQYKKEHYIKDEYSNMTSQKIKDIATTNIIVGSPIKNRETILFVTDIQDDQQGAKVVSSRNLLSGNNYSTPSDTVKYNRFILTDKTKNDVETLVNDYFFKISDRITVLSYDEVLELVKNNRKEFTSLRAKNSSSAAKSSEPVYRFIQQFDGIDASIYGLMTHYVQSIDSTAKDTNDYLRVARIDNNGLRFNDILIALNELTKQNKKGITIYDYDANDLRANNKDAFDKFDLVFANNLYSVRSQTLKEHLKKLATHEQLSEFTFTDAYSDITKKQITAYNIARDVSLNIKNFVLNENRVFKNMEVLFNITCPELFGSDTHELHHSLSIDEKKQHIELHNAPSVLNKSTDELVDLFENAFKYRSSYDAAFFMADEMLIQYLAHEQSKLFLK